MKTQPVIPAEFLMRDGVPFSPEYGDVYHPAAGALAQAQHVFLGGNGLPARWSGQDRFVVLETGFGLGNNFLATWDAWRQDPQRCRQLFFVSIERHPPKASDLATVPRDAALADLAVQLEHAWPPLTHNLHRLSFEGGRVQLLLALGDVDTWMPEIVASVDAFYLDGFAPTRNPQMWQARLFKAMARLAAPGATAATWSAARAVRDGLRTVGFVVEPAAGAGGKRDITVARYEPHFQPRHALARRTTSAGGAPRHVVVVGAGLAGCAAAWALAGQGISSTVIDAADSPASEGSGNLAGLFHGIVNRQDGAHARFNRAAALQAQCTLREFVQSRPAAGSVNGLLRLETGTDQVQAMRRTLDRLGLPADYAQALDAAQASELAGVALAHPAWFYPGGGWVRPGELARWFLDEAGSATRLVGGTRIVRIDRSPAGWTASSATAEVASGEALVLANADGSAALLGAPAWPLERVRGQVSIAHAHALAERPRLPIAGTGYLLPPVDGRIIFGATAQAGDDETACREADHRQNLDQLAALLNRPLALSPAQLEGRVGWRWTADDRLPLVGPVPDWQAAASSSRLDQARLVPRMAGLFVLTGLASRGITWSSLAAQVLASSVSGAPSPLEASLLDAVDPARFIVRRVRRAGGKG